MTYHVRGPGDSNEPGESHDRSTRLAVPGTAVVHAVAVTYMRPHTLAATLEAYRCQSRSPDSLLVVDNGSQAEVRELAAELGAGYLAMSENVGPSGAIAAGMRAVFDVAADDDWILLIDDDDPPPFDTALADVLAVAIGAPADVAVVGLTGSRYNPWTGRLHRVTDDELETFTDVDYVGNGQVPLYRVRALKQVGVFDPGVFIFSEELEFGLRLRAAGWRVVISREPTLRARRISGRLDLGRVAPIRRRAGGWRSYYAARNEVMVARRHGHVTAPAVVTCRLLAGGVVKAWRSRSMEILGPRMRGIADGWMGRAGRVVDP